MLESTIHIGCDIGGTFTDIVAKLADGTLHIRKVASTPNDPGQAVVDGLAGLLKDLGANFGDVHEIVHGTTVGSNTILQKSGARTGLITTKGFRDVLEIGRIRTPRMFDLSWEKPEPLVPRRHRLEVGERMGADGKPVQSLPTDEVIAAGRMLLDEGVESVAICYINSCINSEHERSTVEILEQNFPELLVTASCDVLPEMKEYERTSTTVVNAYLLSEMRRYLANLTRNLSEAGMTAPLLVVASSGGMMRVETASDIPVFAVGSGPAGGVMGAARLGQDNGHENAIAFDMGGTTAKASIIEDGEPIVTAEYEFRDGISTPSRFIKGGGYMLKVPAIDIAEVGAGGGSIAWIDDGGLLQVGPASAGADPGPACYGRGNDRPTVTDTNFVLGYLNPNGLVGGGLGIDRRLSEKAIMDKVGTPLGLDVVQAAAGIRKIANVAMARAIRSVTVERGRDPRDMALMAFGGSGPVHAVEVAGLLGIRKVIVPAMSGVFSSVGMLASDVEHNFVRTLLQPFARLDASQFREVTTRLREDGIGRLSADGFAESQIQLSFGADVRYLGQSSELTVRMEPESVLKLGFDTLESAFHTAYNETYGYKNDEAVELVSVRLSARGIRESRLSFRGIDSQVVPLDIADDERAAWFAAAGDYVVTPTRGRTIISEGRVNGPAILEAYDTTIVIPPHATAVSDGCGSVVIDVPDSAMV
ncbi:MAG: hydantoinase/oxoprolinase family protein [Pseudomonadota bacterium]|nr:hydantoinase/oxoprolinase family protein [Pseudomonadota bacterium]